MEQIRVNPAKIRKTARDISKRADSIRSRSLNYSFTKSKGSTVDALLSLEQSLLSLGTAMADMMTFVSENLKNTADTFERTDCGISSSINGGGVSFDSGGGGSFGIGGGGSFGIGGGIGGR